MRIYRFFIDQDLNKEDLLLKDQEIFHQIIKVLRLKKDDQILLFNKNGKEILAQIIKFEKNIIYLKKKQDIENKKEPKKKVILYSSILKKEKFEIICQKATEIGVYKIQPILAKRTIKLGINQKRLEKIIKEAAEQSGRIHIPELSNTLSFIESLNKAKENELNIFLDPSGEKVSKILGNIPNKVGIFVGPEGGWDESEIEAAEKFKFKIISLGNRILRAETAAILGTFTALLQED